MSDYMPGAVQSPQSGGGGLNASLPPRAVWHITWDALKPDGSQPDFSAVSDYLKRVAYYPTIMWNPFTGDVEQFIPASQSARALVAWNEDGRANIQVEAFFTPGCVVDGIKYATLADTPCVGLEGILAWMDGFGIPRVWPMGAPQWQGNPRDVGIWNTQAGHYGHCNVPDNTHTDPGPMPALTGTITVQGTITESLFMSLTPAEEQRILAAADRINGVITDPNAAILTTNHLAAIAVATISAPIKRNGQMGGETSIGAVAAGSDDLFLRTVSAINAKPAAVTNVAGASIDIDALVARLKAELPAAVTNVAGASIDIDALVARLKAELPAAVLAELTAKLTK